MTNELHVVFGGGQVGQPLAHHLAKDAKQVRIVKRTASDVPPKVDLLRGDATDQAFCLEAARGATAIYHCMNPPYDADVWAELVPRFMDNLIAAAGQSGARLVVLDNVYLLGRPAGKKLNEDTPPDPCTRKGEIRARAAESLFEAHKRGDVVATAGRGSDFYGPGGTLTHLGDHFWPAALAGKTARVLVDPDAIHTYHYIPDVARGLAALGCAADDVYGRPWMLPCASAETLRDLAGRCSNQLGREIRVAAAPKLMMKAIGLFVKTVREVNEMQYQWDEPFVIDDTRFRERFSERPADLEQAATDTLSWAKQTYTKS